MFVILVRHPEVCIGTQPQKDVLTDSLTFPFIISWVQTPNSSRTFAFLPALKIIAVIQQFTTSLLLKGLIYKLWFRPSAYHTLSWCLNTLWYESGLASTQPRTQDHFTDVVMPVKWTWVRGWLLQCMLLDHEIKTWIYLNSNELHTCPSWSCNE